VPVYLTYLTAVPNASGFTFLDDIYNWDKAAHGQRAA
jgi:murein L,D-transpeptidase YcbB/YkuD